MVVSFITARLSYRDHAEDRSAQGEDQADMDSGQPADRHRAVFVADAARREQQAGTLQHAARIREIETVLFQIAAPLDRIPFDVGAVHRPLLAPIIAPAPGADRG